MPKGLGGWLQLWIVLTVIWAVAVATYGWMNLPRAQQMPHTPRFVNKLSTEASLILLGGDSKVEQMAAPSYAKLAVSGIKHRSTLPSVR